ncbi:MAG: proline/glycine betaine ABC transporter permease [Acidiferrobacterales bacterium]|nr:proline/glycine betaine ABC transporter permease [Acidiferrobacterales bacterium]
MSTSSESTTQETESLAEVAAAQKEAQASGAADREVNRAFATFAEQNEEYYSRTFLKIQQSKLPFLHFNKAALVGSFVWAALRGNWLLFWIGFATDMMAAANLGLVYRFSVAKAAAIEADKSFLIERFSNWTMLHLLAAVLLFVIGRLLIGWLADRFYYRQYSAWRINPKVNSGVSKSRWMVAALIVVLVAPLTLYRSTQEAPEARACIKVARAMQDGKPVDFKSRFDCLTISEVPTVVWLKRPPQFSFPRAEDGTRTMVVKESTAKRPVNLNVWLSEVIDQRIDYAKAFYGYIFDGITKWLRTLLNAIEAVFVGTPWLVTAGLFLLIAFHFAGPRVAIFTAATLIYLGIFGFWQTAMSTVSIVIASTIICVVVGLPLGVWVGKSRRGSAIVTPILDVMQTIPSFVYLLPAVAFFSIGKPPGILATVIFSMPPMVRLTALGIKQVPESTKEAALAFGASPRQLLTRVELPLATPSIMAGVNQVVMMSLSMAVIAAIIGAGGLGFIVVDALGQSQVGRGMLAGIAIALIAMVIDRIVQRANRSGS